ncbi:MAG: hypothetical protein ACR2PL_01805 [Dehalococcoidia bacterium]
MDALTGIAVDTFLTWLNSEIGSQYAAAGAGDPVVAVDQERQLAIEVRPLFPVDSDVSWNRRSDAVAAQLREAGAGALELWIPPQTDLPRGDRTDFIRRILQAAKGLLPGQRGQAEFPVTLTLRRLSDEASYVNVRGGLAPHWAKLTGRAFGQYELDSTAIHRLAEPESRIAELLDWVVLLGNGMKAGTTSEMKAEDAWTLRRPSRGDWTAVVGAPPGSDPGNGTAVRKLLRQALKEVAVHPSVPKSARALVLVAVYRGIAEENATIALRSCDPTLYAGFDAICLVADGLCKPLHGVRRAALGG